MIDKLNFTQDEIADALTRLGYTVATLDTFSWYLDSDDYSDRLLEMDSRTVVAYKSPLPEFKLGKSGRIAEGDIVQFKASSVFRDEFRKAVLTKLMI